MFTLLKAGIYTTIQDNGRYMGAHLGIPNSGSMDKKSAQLANLILENDINDALLECTFVGPTLKFDAPTYIAITGALSEIYINDNKIDSSHAVQVNAGDTLTVGRMEKGCRSYIALKGGLQSKVIFRSRSVCLTAGIMAPLKKGDQINYLPYSKKFTNSISLKRTLGKTILSVSQGPEFFVLSEVQQKSLFEESYTILPDSNRMAYRVKHNIDLSHSYSMLSSATLPGTVQLTPSGELICLMRDTQTSGGYPRILQLAEEAICDLAQLGPNYKFTFQLI